MHEAMTTPPWTPILLLLSTTFRMKTMNLALSVVKLFLRAINCGGRRAFSSSATTMTQRAARMAERDKFKRAMAKTVGRDGKKKLGRESGLLLDKVKRMMAEKN
ncbi:hypothetical protein NQ176_g10370 [Zarea fungicola]|uniref:Uncharacterized protein n=1 Tax=Zarea fungicola TaxID=93591 RepID=A0ACC1MGI7_9HYPO|nr:hypothetical protein NQ176_g10370 [Lecanicillium fungicola]